MIAKIVERERQFVSKGIGEKFCEVQKFFAALYVLIRQHNCGCSRQFSGSVRLSLYQILWMSVEGRESLSFPVEMDCAQLPSR